MLDHVYCVWVLREVDVDVDFLFVAVRFLCGVLWVYVYALYVLVQAHLADFLYVLVCDVVGMVVLGSRTFSMSADIFCVIVLGIVFGG